MTSSGANPKTLTRNEWKNILHLLREDLGEGAIRGFGYRKRLCLSSAAGASEMGLGSWPSAYSDGESFEPSWLFTHLTFRPEIPFQACVRLGKHAQTLWGMGKKWLPLETEDMTFDSAYRPITKDLISGKRILSQAARNTIDAVAEVPPQGITLVIDKRLVTLYKHKAVIDIAHLKEFMLRAIACVETLLRPVGSM